MTWEAGTLLCQSQRLRSGRQEVNICFFLITLFLSGWCFLEMCLYRISSIGNIVSDSCRMEDHDQKISPSFNWSKAADFWSPHSWTRLSTFQVVSYPLKVASSPVQSDMLSENTSGGEDPAWRVPAWAAVINVPGSQSLRTWERLGAVYRPSSPQWGNRWKGASADLQ